MEEKDWKDFREAIEMAEKRRFPVRITIQIGPNISEESLTRAQELSPPIRNMNVGPRPRARKGNDVKKTHKALCEMCRKEPVHKIGSRFCAKCARKFYEWLVWDKPL
jgi:hypothetical protein